MRACVWPVYLCVCVCVCVCVCLASVCMCVRVHVCVRACVPAVLAHGEGAHAGPLLRAPHLQDAPARRVDDQELGVAPGEGRRGGRLPVAPPLRDLHPAQLGVPVTWETITVQEALDEQRRHRRRLLNELLWGKCVITGRAAVCLRCNHGHRKRVSFPVSSSGLN